MMEQQQKTKQQSSTRTSTLKTATRRLSDKHYRKWVEDRGLSRAWVEANIYSVSTEVASSLLGYPAKSSGVWIEGANLEGQFRPDKPWRSKNQKGKAPKYRTASGVDYDAILLNHPENPKYWDDIEALKERCYKIDDHPCLFISEGGAKGIAGCSNGLPTIVLLGVEMGLTSSQADVQGKRYLVPALEKYACAGFGFIFAFDADAATNPNVSWAQLKLAHQIKKFNVPQYSITGLWSIEQGKGMDDYIQNNGADKFRREVLAKAEIIEKWERQFKSSLDNKKPGKPPSPRQLGLELAECFQPEWAFHNEQKIWRIYNGKCWDEIEEEAFAQKVFNEVENRGIEWKVPSYIENTIKILKYKLLVKDWVTWDRKRYIAFSNKVLDNETGELLDHNPGFRFTSYLPFDYNGLIEDSTDPLVQLSQSCPHIYDFFVRAMGGDAKKIRKLLAIINGAIKFRFFDLQTFIHCVGKPGTGKGTFARILNKVIGDANTKNSSLTSLSEGTELAGIIDKQLVIFPDERRQVGVEEILKLTGGDKIRYREIYKKRGESYFYGLLLVISNNPVFSGNTTGLDRRIQVVQFRNPIPKNLRSSNAEKNYEKEVAGLIRVALALSNEQVTNLIKGIKGEEIPEFKQQEWLMKCEVSSLAGWANENLIYDPGSLTPVGNGKKDENNLYDIQTLYGNYLDYCSSANIKQTYNLNTFSGKLVELCTDTLEWEGVEKHRLKTGMHIKSVRLRRSDGYDDDSPRIDDLFNCNDGEDLVKSDVDQVKTCGEDFKPLYSKGCIDCDDQNPIKDNGQVSHQVEMIDDHHSKKEEEDLAFTSTPVSQDKGFERYQATTSGLQRSTPDYSSYPHLTCDTLESKRNQARLIKQRLLEADSKEELVAIKGEWSDRFVWVWRNLLSQGEKGRISAIAKTEQLDLF